ncbi:hypothetical protein EB796_008931 [Bugula neritina]|uniref:Uncharacterized protein n=1 Tax=Bugula neritina TaxID=10212 RepID=A0A7J7K291_BUGNE|nr:hypothetical protein EB796_008931 [Bugula neritina]
MDRKRINELPEEHKDVLEGVVCLPGKHHIKAKPIIIPCHNRKLSLSIREDLKFKTLIRNQIIIKVVYHQHLG